MQVALKINTQPSRQITLHSNYNFPVSVFNVNQGSSIAFAGYSAEEVFANIEMGGINSRIKKRFYYSEVDPGKLYRGSKPKEKHINELKKLNIKTIICLKPLKEHKLKKYKEMLEKNSFVLQYLPIDQSKGPKKQDIEKFFEIVNDPKNQPAFLHCHYGFDRTGFFIALYRVANSNYTQDEAFEEMKKFGYSEKMYPEYKKLFYNYSSKKLNIII